jgi:hypothetical protein
MNLKVLKLSVDRSANLEEELEPSDAVSRGRIFQTFRRSSTQESFLAIFDRELRKKAE